MALSVSVVMTTFNGSRWIGEQLDSIARQSALPGELIVCDDGSIDDTLGAVDELAARGLFDVRVLKGLPSGPIGTRGNLQRGLRASTGDVVLLSDQDDVWRSERVWTTTRLIEAGADGVFSDAALIDDAGAALPGSLWQRAGLTADLRKRMDTTPLEVLSAKHVVTGATLGISRRVLEWGLPIATTLWHDAWFALIAAALGDGLVAVDEPLIDYRIHESNQVGLAAPESLRERYRRVTGAGIDHGGVAQHFRAAADRAAERGVQNANVETVREIAEFWADRGRPVGRAHRLPGISRRLKNGEYDRFANGWRSAVIDLLVGQQALAERAAQLAGAVPVGLVE